MYGSVASCYQLHRIPQRTPDDQLPARALNQGGRYTRVVLETLVAVVGLGVGGNLEGGRQTSGP